MRLSSVVESLASRRLFYYQRAQVGVRNESQFWDRVFRLLERDPGGNWYAVAAFSGQSFQTLEALNFEPSDFVPKLTLFETVREIMNYPNGL